ncbi:S1 RNA-binding domain-containing protein [Ferrimonas lipolytica]|uniref:GntR family transcriptional regulator n=1 Tax=Ferrimonas lipolytica TaxID=2724191 RepID=A0A6H1UGX7_9GAMM|nr:S1-like domain-containing RNA-binding protein [Ferrimonas lipolytica]QIZ77466.1 GntR family transcriptional regulator [Ferrimonas lipolytica]
MVEIGQYNTLEVVKKVGFGVYLDGDDLGEILLPKKWVPEGTEVGAKVEVFLYLDSEDQFIATTMKPKAQVGQFASLKCSATTDFGAFLDWGLDKDLLVPFNQQKKPFEEGRFYVVYLYVDQHTDRIAASAKIDRFLDKTPANYSNGEKVSLLIAGKSDIGYKAIINNEHWGVIYFDSVFKDLKPGMRMPGFIKKVRDGGGIDVSINPPVHKQADQVSDHIISYLQNQPNGFAPIYDKTDPETIKRTFGVSKAVFKRAIGGLYKSGQITILKDGIELK